MAVIEVWLNQDQWNEIGQLALERDNLTLTEEEYVDRLMTVLGPVLRSRPSEGDQLRLLLRPRTIISVPGHRLN